MIKCKGNRTNVNGSIIQTLEDMSNIILAVRKTLYKRMPEDIADKCIMTSIKIAYTDENEEALKALIDEMMERLQEGYERKDERKAWSA